MHTRCTHILFLMLCISSLTARAQQPDEVQSIRLDSVVVSERRRSLLLKGGEDGSLVWDMHLMERMPQILGNADPMHYAQMLPGVQTNNEYQGGIHVLGCDNEHNEVSVSGVPVYNVVHLLGFFSTFNATHYPSMSLTETAQRGSFANRLGATLAMQLPEAVPDTVEGEASAGLISSQGTLRMPLSASSALHVSLRASYINLLYGRWLKADDTQVRYSFYDVNATYVSHPNPRNSLIIDAYTGTDHARMSENHYFADMHDRWGNTTGALHWECRPRDDWNLRTTLYTTTYGNRLGLDIVQEHYRLTSRITDFGLKHHASWKRLRGGIETVWHHIKPQAVSGTGSYNTAYRDGQRQNTMESALFCDCTLPLLPRLSADVGVRGSLYAKGRQRWGALDPSATLRFGADGWLCSVGYALRHQYLFQTGFSDMGLPTEFWFSADSETPPQYAHGFTVKGETYLFNRGYQLSVSLYWKQLFHQVEYGGTVLDLVADDYSLSRQLLHGEGENYGASVMLGKCTGRLTGWVSYAYGRARRRYPQEGMTGTYPANHERPHEVNAVATYSLPRHWSFGATGVFCSGTPFTAPVAIFAMNGNIMSQYGAHNANRLGTYYRVDVSVNYRWRHRRLAEQGVNLSLYNLTCHNNDLFHYVRTDHRQQLYYKTVSFVSPILPSVSYSVKL